MHGEQHTGTKYQHILHSPKKLLKVSGILKATNSWQYVHGCTDAVKCSWKDNR